MKKHHTLLLFLLFFTCYAAHGQITQWAFNIGGMGNDDSHVCAIGPNGNIYVAGSFSGTIDLDPSANTYNLTSNGFTDAFLACYTSSGNFVWAFNIGGYSTDGVQSIAIDSNNNIIISGYFRGQNIDFNPSPTATANMSDQGIAGPNLVVGGDGFVAKYTSTGAYQWSIDLGGSTVYDIAEGVTVDESGNVYVGGDFHNTMDIDPSSSVSLLNAVTGSGYLVKYSPSGQLIWGFNFGGGGITNIDNAAWTIRSMKGNLYMVGCFQGTSDFDPSPAAAIHTASGMYDGYLVKYDTAGHFKYVSVITGNAEDQATDLSFDAADNIYITGYSHSTTVNFGNSVSSASPGGGNAEDMFIARYSNDGLCIWAKVIGGPGDDVGYGICVSGNLLYCTGYFHDTVDFDPSSAIYNLVCHGKDDGYLCKYDLDGNFLCGFGYGNSFSDNGRKLITDQQGYLYMCGLFSSAVNFEPSGTPYVLNSNGSTDGYLIKYKWNESPPPASGYLVGDTVCAGSKGHLTFYATQGTAPFTISYSDGYNTYTVQNIQSGQVIDIDSPILQTTQYTLYSVQGSGLCVPMGYPNVATMVLVRPVPVAVVCSDTSLCPNTTYDLYAAGGNSYYWYPATGMDNPYTDTPVISLKSSITYHVVVGNEYGCTDTGMVAISVIPAQFAIANAKNICQGDSLMLSASGGNEYKWSPPDSLSSDSVANPVVWPHHTTNYTVTIHEDACGRSATLSALVNVLPLPDVHITEVHDIDCGMKAGALDVSGAYSYQWSPAATLSDAHIANPVAHPMTATTYTVIGTDRNGCKNTDTATVQVFNDGTGRLFAPTAFTPNGDGLNDCFRIRIPGTVTDYKLIVCNRWGQVVFTTYNINDCWNGIIDGTPQSLGTYYYFYTANSSSCGWVKGKGDVTLIR